MKMKRTITLDTRLLDEVPWTLKEKMEGQWRKPGCAHPVNRACWEDAPDRWRLADNTPIEQEEYE